MKLNLPKYMGTKFLTGFKRIFMKKESVNLHIRGVSGFNQFVFMFYFSNNLLGKVDIILNS